MLKDALRNNFGLNCNIEEIKLKGLPLYLVSGRKFYKVDMEKISFLIVNLSDNDKFGVVALNKQLSLYYEKTALNVAFCFQNLNRIQRDALISKGIPFVSVPDQIYLPFLGTILSNRFKTKMMVSGEKMMPAAQCLFLYLMYHADNDYVTKSMTAIELGLAKTSITRASAQLKQMKLIREESVGKEIQMSTLAKGIELYQMAKSHLINPVQKTMHVEMPTENLLYIAGESTLSKHSMLSAPKEETYAIYKNNSFAKSLKEVDSKWQEKSNICCVELWKYDPGLFAINGEVDPISLAMSLEDNTDERVQGELQTYLEEYKW